jgi:pantoate--beta-alanine ligase
MQVFHDIDEARQAVEHAKRSGTVGVVPTMGALHPGHGSLMRQSVQECKATFATIFVNPTQFAATEDLSKYPRTLDADLELCRSIGVDGVLVPEVAQVYPPGYSTSVNPPRVASDLEGKFRPEHFGGVATVVLKLFQMIPATHAYFGRKDYQQWRVIEQMVQDLNVPIRIIGCPIIRDPDGLAMSSRNVYLSPADRKRALALSATLATARSMFESGERNVTAIENAMRKQLQPQVDQIDYAVVRDAQSLEPIDQIEGPTVVLLATRVGTTRLIDNCELIRE